MEPNVQSVAQFTDRVLRRNYQIIADAIEEMETEFGWTSPSSSEYYARRFEEYAARLLTCANKLREPEKDA